MTSPTDEKRTKLSSKAHPFRPSIGGLSTTSSLTDSRGPPAFGSHPNLTDLDSSTGSVRTSVSAPNSSLTPPTPPGQFHPPAATTSSWASAWMSFCGPDSQGAASSNDASSSQLDVGEFSIADFRSKLLQRAQTLQKQTPQAPFKKNDFRKNKNEALPKGGEAWTCELRFMQALMSDGFPMTRNANQTGRGQSSELRIGDRRQAMNKCMQPSDLDSSGKSFDVRAAPLQHAATFNEGMGSKDVSKDVPSSSNDPIKEALPVRNTFIHFAEACDGPGEPPFQWSSAPAIMMLKEFHTRYPKMEVAHLRGACRPCVYFTKKEDGCRWGADCEFCHLCPVGSVQRKRKEKVKALREKEYKELQDQDLLDLPGKSQGSAEY